MDHSGHIMLKNLSEELTSTMHPDIQPSNDVVDLHHMDHSMHDMDHSGMDHSGMDHSGMDHSGMDHSNSSMGHSMKMYFHTGSEETILFFGWTTTSWGAMLGSCIVILIAAMLYEGLKVLREHLVRQALRSQRYEEGLVPTDENHVAINTATRRNSYRCTKFSMAHLIQTLLHVLQIIVSYMLMLVVMTFNVWLCLSVVAGAGLGFFLFGWRRRTLTDINEHCQ